MRSESATNPELEFTVELPNRTIVALADKLQTLLLTASKDNNLSTLTDVEETDEVLPPVVLILEPLAVVLTEVTETPLRRTDPCTTLLALQVIDELLLIVALPPIATALSDVTVLEDVTVEAPSCILSQDARLVDVDAIVTTEDNTLVATNATEAVPSTVAAAFLILEPLAVVFTDVVDAPLTKAELCGTRLALQVIEALAVVLPEKSICLSGVALAEELAFTVAEAS